MLVEQSLAIASPAARFVTRTYLLKEKLWLGLSAFYTLRDISAFKVEYLLGLANFNSVKACESPTGSHELFEFAKGAAHEARCQ